LAGFQVSTEGAGNSDHQTGGPLDAFIPFKNGALRGVMLPPSGHRNRPRFPFEECLNVLASESPSWPKRTGEVSEIEIGLQFGPANGNAADKEVANVTLRVVDYPGEWLLDLPLLSQSFAEWSAATIALSRERSRAELSKPWFTYVSEHDFTAPNEDAISRQAAELYRDYLVECRRRGLRFLQPGHFLRHEHQEEESAHVILDRPQLWFCPLPAPGGNWKTGSIGAAMEERYKSYGSETVGGFLADTFGRFGRQLVLVDVRCAERRRRSIRRHLPRTQGGVRVSTHEPGKPPEADQAATRHFAHRQDRIRRHKGRPCTETPAGEPGALAWPDAP
jgi:predicted YcjX-like family ATPase